MLIIVKSYKLNEFCAWLSSPVSTNRDLLPLVRFFQDSTQLVCHTRKVSLAANRIAL